MNKTPLRSVNNVLCNITPSRNHNYRKGKVAEGDRFVPLRSEEHIEFASHLFSNKDNEFNTFCSNKENDLNTSSSCPTSPASKYEQQTKLQMMRVKSEGELNGGDRICAFRKGLAPRAALGHRQQAAILYSSINPSSSCVKRSRRYITKDPERMLDAPNLLDDFYTNLVDWSKSNIVAVALGQKIFLWYAATGEVKEMYDFTGQESSPTLVKWSKEGQFLAIAFDDGRMKLFDANNRKLIRTLKPHIMTRIVCACWSKKGQLSFGARNGRIYHHDVTQPNSLISIYESHNKEVCGLKWSPDERYLTSGGSDALVNVWESSQTSTENATPIWTFDDHTGTVKAIEYGLGPNLVATGGGINDHYVRIWNVLDGTTNYALDTQSQVTGILFNKTHGEMITAHGNPHNGIKVWHHEPSKIKKYEHMADLNQGQAGRVLSLCQSPCGEYVMAASQDEVLRLWHVWKVDESVRQQSNESVTAKALNARKQLNYRSSNGGGNIR